MIAFLAKLGVFAISPHRAAFCFAPASTPFLTHCQGVLGCSQCSLEPNAVGAQGLSQGRAAHGGLGICKTPAAHFLQAEPNQDFSYLIIA